MTPPTPVGKRGSLLFSVILEPSDTESEVENIVEDIKEENVEVAIFEKYFWEIEVEFFYIEVFHSFSHYTSMSCSWHSLTNSPFHEFSFDRRMYVQFWSVVTANPFLEVYTICPQTHIYLWFTVHFWGEK